MSKNSYLSSYNAQVSQNVFLDYLIVLPLITTLWVGISEISYLCGFNAQVSQIVFSAYLTVLRLITTVWPEMSENSIFAISVNKNHKSVFLAYLTVLRLITIVWPEFSENSYLRDLTSQVSQIPFLTLFDRFTAYYNCMTWIFRKLNSPRFQCTSITNRFLS